MLQDGDKRTYLNWGGLFHTVHEVNEILPYAFGFEEKLETRREGSSGVVKIMDGMRSEFLMARVRPLRSVSGEESTPSSLKSA